MLLGLNLFVRPVQRYIARAWAGLATLAHNRKAVHRAYAKRALMKLPSLEEYEREAAEKIEDAT
jgi:hypothetical protein